MRGAHQDGNNKNQDFKSRAMAAAERNSAPTSGGQSGGNTGSKQAGTTNSNSGGDKK